MSFAACVVKPPRGCASRLPRIELRRWFALVRFVLIWRTPPPGREGQQSRAIRFRQSQNAPLLAIGFKPTRSVPIDGVPSFFRVRLDVRVVG